MAPPGRAPWLIGSLLVACGDSGYDPTATAPTSLTTLTTLPPLTSGETESSGGSTEASASEPATSTSSGGGPKFDVGEETAGGSTGGGPDPLCPCAPKLDLIYVLSDDRELWTYDPEANAFAMVGALGCPTTAGTFSMGVGRDGFAWVQTTELDPITLNSIGDLFRLDVTNPANCTDPGYTPGAGGWQQFGMAFVSKSAEDQCDQLYGQHWNGVAGMFTEGPNFGKLGVFDPVQLFMSTIGSTNYNGAELTGTGDGRIYAFGGVPDSKLIQFDKMTAKEIEVVPFPGFPLTNAFAFAFWGGDFYFFTNSVPDGIGTTSKVTRLDYDKSEGGGLSTVSANAPILIVGAGVSTCAPVLPPG